MGEVQTRGPEAGAWGGGPVDAGQQALSKMEAFGELGAKEEHVTYALK